tara:strand:- start:1516 stop:1707 length:192 start_codon:yes stop_codon:yes gene_type:complete
MHWDKLYIHPSDKTSKQDIIDFVEWVYQKAERLGFQVELKPHQDTGSGSSDAVSTNPMDKTNE